MSLTSELFAELVAEANLAPSVHNTQPTRWRLQPDGSVRVLEDATRRLPVGDPQGRDAAVSHGCAIEGFAIAASARGMAVEVQPEEGAPQRELAPVARLTLSGGASRDPLHACLLTRRTYRGTFERAEAPAGLAALEAQGDVRLVAGPADIGYVAALNDAASLPVFRDGGYRAELVSWMRFSRRDPRWSLDGLNAEAMAMSPLEAAGAATVLRPGVFEGLDRVGLAPSLIAERKVVASALVIALFHRPAEELPLQTGRRFHRLWLQLEAMGLSAAPMAVLADDARARETLAHRFGLARDRRLITALRIGRAPARPDPAPKPRLPAGSLLVGSD